MQRKVRVLTSRNIFLRSESCVPTKKCSELFSPITDRMQLVPLTLFSWSHLQQNYILISWQPILSFHIILFTQNHREVNQLDVSSALLYIKNKPFAIFVAKHFYDLISARLKNKQKHNLTKRLHKSSPQ